MNCMISPGVLSEDILTVIDLILEKCPDAVFGGSIALNAVGLLNRKVGDIDLFLNKKYDLKVKSIKNILGMEIDADSLLSETVTDTNGQNIQRIGTKINGVHVCIFKVSDEELEHSLINFQGRILKIQNVNYAIQAKIAYSKRTNKHVEDLERIHEVIDLNFV